MIFTHGWECYNTWYNFTYQNLVPHGFILILPNDYSGNNDTATELSQSQRYTLDWIYNESNNNITSPLYGLTNNKYIASGHSMGGGATILSVSNANINQPNLRQFDTAIILSGCCSDGCDYNAYNIEIPVFLFTATHDCMCKPGKSAYKYYNDIKGNCKFLADIYNGTHCSFMDAPEIHQDACKTFDYGGCPLAGHENIELQTQIDIVNEYMLLWMQEEYGSVVDQLGRDKENGVMSNVEYVTNAC